jgi:N-acetylglucosaminyldiphosphoundecaprenol N-acetyl-beta-D-mannosaminyltransferase
MNRISVLGVGVDPVAPGGLIEAVETLSTHAPATVAYANAHVLNTAVNDPKLTAFLESADLVYCDGNGVRLASRLLGDPLPSRMTGADWIWELAAAAEGRLRLYWLGGEPETSKTAAQRLCDRHPQLEIQTDHGFHARSGPADAACIRRINAFSPDILLVGMGTPTQEHWVAQRRTQLDVPVVWCVGATAEVLAGHEHRGPRWLVERAEWLSRMAQDPVRLWRRYLIGNPLFLARVLRQRLG